MENDTIVQPPTKKPNPKERVTMAEEERQSTEIELNKQERSIPINLPCVTMTTHPTKKSNPKKRVTKAQVERYKEDDIFFSIIEDESSEEADDSNKEWRMTPLFKRIRKERKSLVGGSRANSRKNLAATSEMNQKSRSSSLKESHETPDIQEFFRRNSLQSHKEVQKKRYVCAEK
eukprot:TRINITY_DN17417_c0_g1_i5.p1 TRINITY_DN17417_c0_g1~~TRINITY_DN17417_c0_g1_i5.p1  ORF type:complete len:175 (-),score=48.72 TRINITY_DN17417_c0_g1_i5:80-604(-)